MDCAFRSAANNNVLIFFSLPSATRTKRWPAPIRRVRSSRASHSPWWRTPAGTRPTTAWPRRWAGDAVWAVRLRWRAVRTGSTRTVPGMCVCVCLYLHGRVLAALWSDAYSYMHILRPFGLWFWIHDSVTVLIDKSLVPPFPFSKINLSEDLQNKTIRYVTSAVLYLCDVSVCVWCFGVLLAL